MDIYKCSEMAGELSYQEADEFRTIILNLISEAERGKGQCFFSTCMSCMDPCHCSSRTWTFIHLCWVVVGLRPPPGATFLRGDSLTRLCLRGDCCCCVGVVLPVSDAGLPLPAPQLESSDVPPLPLPAGAGVTVTLPSRVPSSGVCDGVVVLCSVPQSSARNPSCIAGLRTIPGVIASLSALSRCAFLVLGCEMQQELLKDWCIIGCDIMHSCLWQKQHFPLECQYICIRIHSVTTRIIPFTVTIVKTWTLTRNYLHYPGAGLV